MGLEFGECVMWRRRPVGSNLAKLAVLWDVGVYLGVKGSTGEIIIGNGDGVWRTRTVRRRPEELRWRAEEIEKIKGLPWDHEGEKKEDKVVKLERLPEELMQQEKGDHQGGVETGVCVRHEAGGLREVRLQPRLPGMPGFANGHHQAEATPQCRQRMEKEMGELERVKNAKRRREEFLEKVTVPADGEVVDEDSVKKTSKNYDIKIDDDEMTLDGRAASSGIDSERKRTWQEIDGQDSASKSKKEKHEFDKEGDVDMGAMEVNIEEDERSKWEYDEDQDGEFDPKLPKGARLEEVNFMQNIGVWEPSTWEECMQKTGKAPITTKWVDVDKGRDGEVLIRSRLVARENKNDERNFDVFAATPPQEMKRLLFRMARVKGSLGGNDKDGQVKLMYIDVKKAHLNDDDFAYITLPKKVGGGVGRLRRWLYGMRPAASAWEEHYAANLKNEGYERGRAAPTAFTNKETGVRVVVWGDDFTFLGRERYLKEIGAKMG